MAELFSAPIETNRALDQLGIDQFRSSTDKVLAATWDETIAGNPYPLSKRAIERGLTNRPEVESFPYSEWNLVNPDPGATVANPYYVESPLLTPEEANQKYGITGGGKDHLKWTAPVREREAKELNDLKRDELLRQDIIARGAGGFWQGTAKLGVGLAGSIVDPINILSAFIPVVGEANFARILGVTGSRALTRAIVGGIEGAAGAAMLEPVVYGLSKAEQRDYDMTDSMMNIAFGTVLGGGLHVVGGAAKDRLFGIPKLIDDAPLETKRAMLGDALVSVLEDRPVRADLALREHLLGGTSNTTPLDMARMRFENAMGPFQPDPARVDMGGIKADVPHPAPDRATTSLPILSEKGEAFAFTTIKRAENAADRIERNEGVRPEVVRQGDEYVVRRATDIEPVYKTDGSVMTFDNERSALRYRDQILKDQNLDVMPVSDGGPVRYSLVAGATEADLKAARARPDSVDMPMSRDVAAKMQEEAAEIQANREQFERDVDQWLQERRNQQPRASADDLRIYADNQVRLERASGEAEAIRREGGRTEQTLIERDLADLDEQIKAIDAVGELPAEAKTVMKEADDIVKAAEERGNLFDRIAACVRGS